MSQHEVCYELWRGDLFVDYISQHEWSVLCEGGRGFHWVKWLPGFGP
jgi:hypothetical protein